MRKLRSCINVLSPREESLGPEDNLTLRTARRIFQLYEVQGRRADSVEMAQRLKKSATLPSQSSRSFDILLFCIVKNFLKKWTKQIREWNIISI
jgi:hypothetical protein